MKSDARGRAWEQYFVTTNRLAARIEATLKTSTKLTLPEYNVLLQVSRAGTNGIRLGNLARELVFSPSRLTHTLKRLTDRGLVKRTICESDARGGLIVLTDEGRTLFSTAAAVHRDLVRALAIEGLSEEEISTLTRVFSRIAQRLDEDELLHPCDDSSQDSRSKSHSTAQPEACSSSTSGDNSGSKSALLS